MRPTPLPEYIVRDWPQYRVFAVLSLVTVVLTGLLHNYDASVFARVLGGIHPLAASVLMVVLGFAGLSRLVSRDQFAIYRHENRRGLWLAGGLAALFGIIIIPADLIIVYPDDINVPLPESLLFYPVVGFFAEILFHVVPLSILLILLSSIFRAANRNRIIWFSIGVVALLEPIYQTLWMVSLDRYPVWAVAYDATHVFAINLLQLILFRRYDFVSMYALRLVYYLFWHIGWGTIRLEVLF